MAGLFPSFLPDKQILYRFYHCPFESVTCARIFRRLSWVSWPAAQKMVCRWQVLAYHGSHRVLLSQTKQSMRVVVLHVLGEWGTIAVRLQSCLIRSNAVSKDFQRSTTKAIILSAGFFVPVLTAWRQCSDRYERAGTKAQRSHKSKLVVKSTLQNSPSFFFIIINNNIIIISMNRCNNNNNYYYLLLLS